MTVSELDNVVSADVNDDYYYCPNLVNNSLGQQQIEVTAS